MSSDLPPNVDRFSGFADTYDAYRPKVPAVVVDLLTQIAECPRPKLVVDIGCGTGLSTRVWADRADKVIGIEPNPDMRAQAEQAADARNVTYQPGTSTETGLPDACADIVTISQALHWMEPEPAFAEVARILRPGGVFASIDYDWPPVMNWEAEAAYTRFSQRTHKLEEQYGVAKSVDRWSKNQHLARIRESNRFRYTREALVHSMETGNAERLVGLALSLGGIETLLKKGLTEEEIGITDLRKEAARALGDKPGTWFIGYRIRIAVK